MMLTAKQLIPNKSWIVENGREKVATINKEKKGYSLTSRGKKFEAHDLSEIKDRFGITVADDVIQKEKRYTPAEKEIYGYPVKSRAYNPLWNVQKRLPIYAKSLKSKSFYCAGYYAIIFPKLSSKAFCPKLITLERYPFYGPFKTEEEVRVILNNLSKGTHCEQS